MLGSVDFGIYSTSSCSCFDEEECAYESVVRCLSLDCWNAMILFVVGLGSLVGGGGMSRLSDFVAVAFCNWCWGSKKRPFLLIPCVSVLPLLPSVIRIPEGDALNLSDANPK